MLQRLGVPRILTRGARMVCLGTLTTVALLTSAFGIASYWDRYQFYYSPRGNYHWRVYAAWGFVGFHRMDKGSGTGIHLSISRLKQYTRPRSLIRIQWWVGPVGKTTITVPWWLVTPACAAYPAIALIRAPLRRRRRRRLKGLCLACGYDLTGNVSGRCPECGAKTS